MATRCARRRYQRESRAGRDARADAARAGDDPYEAIGSTFRPKTLAKAGDQTEPGLDPDKPIKRAIPVVPTPDETIEVRRALPVRPIDESGTEPLLQNEPPAPLDFSDDH